MLYDDSHNEFELNSCHKRSCFKLHKIPQKTQKTFLLQKELLIQLFIYLTRISLLEALRRNWTFKKPTLRDINVLFLILFHLVGF